MFTLYFASYAEINVCFLPLSSGGNNDTRIPSNICGDHGDCHSLLGGNFTCSCHDGFTGERCRDGMSEGVLLHMLIVTSLERSSN